MKAQPELDLFLEPYLSNIITAHNTHQSNRYQPKIKLDMNCPCPLPVPEVHFSNNYCLETNHRIEKYEPIICQDWSREYGDDLTYEEKRDLDNFMNELGNFTKVREEVKSKRFDIDWWEKNIVWFFASSITFFLWLLYFSASY
tara:strand:+ start:959 stop:1387 length:429 start_codon:yes stop_codon:yes gene_type:complete